MEHPELESIIAPFRDLRDDVIRKAQMRLSFEGLDKSDPIVNKSSPYYQKPDLYGMERYSYYQCYKCKKVTRVKMLETYTMIVSL